MIFIILGFLFSSFSSQADSGDCKSVFVKNTKSNGEYMSYELAQQLMKEHEVTSVRQFYKWSKMGLRPANLPSQPEKIYKTKWQGWREFLGTEKNREDKKKDYMSYGSAQQIMKEHGITSQRQFQEWSKSDKRPANFPSKPEKIYKTKWQSWGEFLGTGQKRWQKMDFMSYESAKGIVREQGITTVKQFQEWSKAGLRPANLPSKPEEIYKTKWQSWGEFLGTEKIHKRQKRDYMSYGSAQQIMREHKIKTERQFREWSRSKRPQNFPSNPWVVYKSEWKSWNEFLGTEKGQKRDYMSYESAQQIMKEHGITSYRQFYEWSKAGLRPANLPSRPEEIYKTKWLG